jgi:magnesium transporter
MKPAKSFIHKRLPPGTSPGTLRVSPHAPSTVVSIIGYGPNEVVEERNINPSTLASLKDRFAVLWVNIEGLGSAEVIKNVGQAFDLHALSLEDIVNVHQRPKVESYDHYQFIVLRSFAPGLQTDQMSFCLGQRYVLTFQEHPGDPFDPVRARLAKPDSRLRNLGADYLAYALIDTVVDNYFPVLEDIGEQLETIEEHLLAGATHQLIQQIHEIKRHLLHIRRAIWPLRQELTVLIRDTTPFFSDTARFYLRDTYDHTLQLMDVVETQREIASGLADFYLSSMSHRLSEVMRVLTVISTVFIPLTFIAGVYGMNFDPTTSPWNMPEVRWYWGYPAALAVMAATAGGFLWKRLG